MRTMEFKVERSGLIKVGDELEVIETELETFLFYTIRHAYGMSGNIPFSERLSSRKGEVVGMEEKARGCYVTLAFEDEEKGG